MERGRPAVGPNLVEGLEGTEGAKKRLRVVLETMAGEKSVEEACRELGIGKSAFHQIRARIMQGALEDLEPKAPGRKPSEASDAEERIAQLEKELEETKLKLKIAHVREELLLGMPEVMDPVLLKKKRMEARKKRNRALKKQRQKKRRRG
jgi:transposase-like protein